MSKLIQILNKIKFKSRKKLKRKLNKYIKPCAHALWRKQGELALP